MVIEKVQPKPIQPPAECLVRLSYTELHELYHTMLELGRRQGYLAPFDQEFFDALKEHA